MKTEAIERLIHAVDFWVTAGVFDNTVFNPITDDAKEELKAIDCANFPTQLDDKKEPTFEEWVYMNNYTPIVKKYIDQNSTIWTEHELIKIYNEEVINP